ncbi:Calx-beta domain-containing protein [Candidatus Halobeggiatoa sp. HSG11]|nr:Calx-beta domain-containing protein [Candidatus Halobeggiatoa sp. HSG11]
MLYWGARDVYVTTGSEIATKLAGFAVFSPASISLNTNQGQQGNNIQLMITGDRTNFEQNVTQINFGGNGITSSVNVINKTTIVANVQIANDAEPTTRDISVVTGEEVVAFLNAFTVTAPPVVDEPNISIPELPQVIPSIIEFTEKTKEVAETGNVVIVAKRTDSNVGKVTVKYSTTSASAKAGEDFTAVNGIILTWEDGDDKDKEITISILDDENMEEDETFTLKLTDVIGNASLGLSETEITILNNDKQIIVEQPTDGSNETNSTDGSDETNSTDDSDEINSTDGSDETNSTDDSDETNSTDNSDINNYFNDISITTEPIVRHSQPTPPKPCPESNKIHTYCTFNNKEIGDVFIAENASVSNIILVGNMENYGWASNLIIKDSAKVTGLNSENDEIEGILTGM